MTIEVINSVFLLRARAYFFLIFSLTVAAVSWGGAGEVAPGVAVAPPGDWVEADTDFSPPSSPPYAEGGVHFFLSSHHFRPGEDAVFSRLVMEFQSQAGLEGNSTLTWNVDPEFESVALHWIRVYRDGEWIDLLPDVEIDVVDARTDVQSWFYDDSKDVRIILERIQVGDVLDYGYTRVGSNPVVGDYYSSMAPLGYGVPVERIEVRMDWPENREGFRYKTFPRRIEPQVSRSDGHEVFQWDLENVEAVITDQDVPPGYERVPWVQFSSWPDWASVAQWAVDLYPTEAEAPAEIREKAAEILAAGGSAAEKATKALQYVQDRFRYVSIPVGPHSYQPYPVTEILGRRYGDCKDKSLLLVLLLRELGIDSDPVLVDADGGELINKRLPTQAVFDHVVVGARIDGERVWMDPTDSHEGGVLPNRYFDNFGFGLVISPETTGLVADVGPQASDEAAASATEVFTFSAYEDPVELTVRTEFQGRDADRIRSDLATNGVEYLKRIYANYYASLYNVIPESRAMEIEDDRRENRLLIEERYQLPALFKDGMNGEEVVNFPAEVIRDLLPWPRERIRSGPFALPRPRRQEQTLILHLPDDSVFEAEEFALKNEWVSYEVTVRQSERRLAIRHKFEILAGAVPADQMGDYLAAIQRIDEHLDYSIEIDWDRVGGSGFLSMLARAFSHSAREPEVVDSGDTPQVDPAGNPGEPPGALSIAEGILIGAGGFLLGIGLSAWFFHRRRQESV